MSDRYTDFADEDCEAPEVNVYDVAAAITAAVRCDWLAMTCQVVFAITTAWAAAVFHARAYPDRRTT